MPFNHVQKNLNYTKFVNVDVKGLQLPKLKA